MPSREKLEEEQIQLLEVPIEFLHLLNRAYYILFYISYLFTNLFSFYYILLSYQGHGGLGAPEEGGGL